MTCRLNRFYLAMISGVTSTDGNQLDLYVLLSFNIEQSAVYWLLNET